MKFFILICLTISCARVIQKQESAEFKISSDIYQSYKIPYEKEERSIEMTVPVAPLVRFIEAWNAEHAEDLLPRNEYSIPVVSPSEMNQLLTKMKKEEIDGIARSFFIQNSRFNVKCVGQKEMKNHDDYFLVLESEDLARIRIEILEVYRLRGGDRKDFLATDYTPLIPLNKTPTSEEGLSLKSDRDCLANVKAAPPFEGPAPVLNL